MTRARCDVDGCHELASVHIIRTTQRVCAKCARQIAGVTPVLEPARFPRAAIMLEAVAVAEVLRNAATELDELAGAAPAYEVGTLRRKVRAIVLGAVAFAEVSTEGDECAPQT
ncbi:MAG: hypothetical protein WDO74_23420 [Pseudomonadota bacterium]